MKPSEIVVAPPTMSLPEAARLMRQNDIHHLIVMDMDVVRGIVSDRDMWSRGFTADGVALSPSLTVADVMTPLSAPITDETDVTAALRLMRDHGVSALPIVRDGRVIGIVTESDVIDVLDYAIKRDTGETVEVDDPDSLEGKAKLLLGRPLMQNFLQLLGEAGI